MSLTHQLHEILIVLGGKKNAGKAFASSNVLVMRTLDVTRYKIFHFERRKKI